MAETKSIQFHLSTAIKLMFLASALLWLVVNVVPRLFSHPQGRARESLTRKIIYNIATACEHYQLEWGSYPPDVAPIGFNGPEALYYYLATPFRSMPNLAQGEVKASKDFGPYIDFPAQWLVTSPAGRRSIIDPWGQPIEYDNIRDDKTGPNGLTPRPNDPRAAGKPRNTQGIDLWSPGPPGANAPITNWK